MERMELRRRENGKRDVLAHILYNGFSWENYNRNYIKFVGQRYVYRKLDATAKT